MIRYNAVGKVTRLWLKGEMCRTAFVIRGLIEDGEPFALEGSLSNRAYLRLLDLYAFYRALYMKDGQQAAFWFKLFSFAVCGARSLPAPENLRDD